LGFDNKSIGAYREALLKQRRYYWCTTQSCMPCSRWCEL